jgi:hypothetical protein
MPRPLHGGGIIKREEKRAFRNDLIKTIICHSRKIGGKNINKTSR